MKKHFLSLLLCALVMLSGCSRQCQAHVDADGNDICDECGSSVIIIIDFYAVNDLHGKIMDADTQPGVDELTTYFQQAGQTDENAILLSTGDMWQGSAESNMTKGQLMTDWMNQLDFAAMAMGNHEFDWGEEYIEANAEFAQFPFLAINIYDRETNAPVDYCQPSVVLERDGVQIGIIGAIGDCYSSISPDRVEQVYFKTGAELTALVKAEAERLRSQGVDFIVYSLHDGLGQSMSGSVSAVEGSQLSSYYDTSLSDGYVDLVFEAHTHQRYLLQDEYGVYHLQNGGDNNGISHVEVEIHAITGSSRIREAELIATSDYASLEDAPLVEELLQKYEEEIAPAFQVVGTLDTSCPGDTMRQLVADLYFLAGIEKWGAEYDIVLGGGFISIRDPGYLARGEVTYGELQTLFPFDNELVLCSIRGRDLQARFFETDNSNYFISCGIYGETVMENIDPDGIYYMVVDSYSSTYAPNKLTEVDRYGEGIFARDLLADYIAGGGLS